MGNTPIDIFRRPPFGLGHPLPEDSLSGHGARETPGPQPEAEERSGDGFESAAPVRFAGAGGPRSLLLRDAEVLRSRLPAELDAGGFFEFTAGLEGRAEALAFFRGFQVIRELGSLEPQILSTRELDAETLEQALRHFEALDGENLPDAADGASASDPATILRGLARAVAAQNPDQADVVQSLANERLICRAYSALLRVEGRASDRDALRASWMRRHEALSQYPVGAETLSQDYAELSEILLSGDLPELRPLLSDSIQAQVDAGRRPAAGTDPRAAILGRQQSFDLLRGTWEALGETGRQLFLDVTEELDRDALGLEREAAGAESALRLQLLGEAAALYRRLAAHPEAGEHYRGRLRATLESLLEAAGGEAVDPELRLRAVLQVAREFEAEGDPARAEAIRADLSARAERALRRGGRSRSSIVDRYADLREALSIYRELGPESSREAASRSLESLLRGVLEGAARRDNPELRREAEAFALEGYLELGDLEAAEILWCGLRAGLPRPEAACREGGVEPTMDVDACAAWLRRLGAYAQRLAVARADGAETVPDFSLFREALSDLAALGARHGRRTMALYGRFMLAVLDRDSAAETLYEQLQGVGSPVEDGLELPIHDILLAASGIETPSSEVEPDEYQRMAREIWERHRPFLTLERCLPTLGFLSQMIEGNYQQRLAMADEEGHSRIPILAEREAMRRSLAFLQQALVEGRAATTAEAVALLPDLLGDEAAARDFYRGLGGAFAYEGLDGVEHRDTDLARRLIDVERSADPEIRAQRYLSLAREMVVADGLNRRCDGLIAALLQAAEDSGARGRAPRPLMEILGNLANDSRGLGDFSELYNRLAGNETLQAQIQAFRDVTPYIQTMNQVVDSVFSVEGGAILLASIFTGGLAAELAGAALLARLGAGAYVVADGAVAMTWTARAAVGATRIAAAWAARSATELGGIAVYRAATGRRQMDLEEVRLRLITSLFCSVGDEFATHFTRAFLGRALRPVFGETARGMARTRSATEVAEFFASGLGEMCGEDVGGRVAGRAPDTRPFLVRYFEETLHGSFFVAGTRVGGPLAEAVTSRLRPAETFAFAPTGVLTDFGHAMDPAAAAILSPDPMPGLSPAEISENPAEPAGSGLWIERNGLSEEGVPVEGVGSPPADAHPPRGSLVPGLIGREGNARIRHYRLRRLVQSEGRAVAEVESLDPGLPAARFILGLPMASPWEAGQELSFIPAVEGGSGRDEASGPRGMFFPLRLSRYELRGGERGALRMQIVPDPDGPGRYRTSGHGFLIFRSEAGRVRGRDLESASRLTLFDPGSGIAVDSLLPVGPDDLEAFLEDFRDLREHLETMGFDFGRARVNLVYGTQEGAAAATTSHAGPDLARRLERLGIRFESVRPAESGEPPLDLDLATGALLAEGEEVFRRAEAPTLPPSAPRDAVDASNFYLFEEWLESAVALAANQPGLEEFTRGLGSEWERREITFPTMIRRLRDYIRTETEALTRPGLYASLAGALASQDLVDYAHAILEQESLSLQEVWPGEQQLWDTEEGLARVQLIRALVRNGIFEGEINPVYHLARIRDSGARYLAWRELLTGLVVRGQERRAQELLISFSRNSRVGTPAAERELLWTLFREIRSEFRGPRGEGGGTGAVTALLAAGAGAATLLGADTAHAAFEVSGLGEISWGIGLGLGFATTGVFTWFTNRFHDWRSRNSSDTHGDRSQSPYRDASHSSAVQQGSLLPSSVVSRVNRLRGHWANRELRHDTRLEALEGYFRELRNIPLDQTGFFAEQAVHLRENFEGMGDWDPPTGWYAWFDFLFPANDSIAGAGYARSALPRQAVQIYQWLLGRLPPGHHEVYRGAEFLLDQPDGRRDLGFLRRLMKRGLRSFDPEASEFARLLHEMSSDSNRSASAREDASVLHCHFRRLNKAEPEGDAGDRERVGPRVRVEPEVAPPEILDVQDSTLNEEGASQPPNYRRREGGDGLTVLLAAGSGVATLLGADAARAQDSLDFHGGGALDIVSWVALGGVFAAGLAYLYANWRRSSGRLHLERIAALYDPARSEEERRELAEWLRREARENPEAFGAEAVRALRSDLRRDSLPALDVYMALLETDHPVARQFLTAADVRRCEAMILAQARGADGVQRLLDAALRARVSARLIDAVAQRINHPFVGQQLVAGIVTGQLRSALVLLKAMQEAHPDRVETLEDLLTALRRSAQRNYHARRFLERVLGRPDLARFHEQARVEAETPGRGGSGGSTLAWLAAGAGGAAWLGADTAHAAAGIVDAAGSGRPGWLLGAALGLGVLGMAVSRDGGGAAAADLTALSGILFRGGRRLSSSQEVLRESFFNRFHRMTSLEKAERLRALLRLLPEVAAAEDSPLAIDPDFLSLLLRQEDPRFAHDFFQALAGLPPHPEGGTGRAVQVLLRGLERRGLLRHALPDLRELRPEDSRPFRTPAWMQRFRERLAGGFSERLNPRPARLALRDILPIHYLDNHARGDGAAALNAVRRSILSRLALQHWTPGRPPEEGALALALIDDESRLPVVSLPDARGLRLLLNGHHRVGALLSLVADGLLPEQTLERIPFHEASEIAPEALIRHALARASLPNPNHAVNWRELLAFDPATREWLDRRGGGGDLVAWLREVRTAPRGRRASKPEE